MICRPAGLTATSSMAVSIPLPPVPWPSARSALRAGFLGLGGAGDRAPVRLHVIKQRRGDKERGIGADDDAPEHREAKAAQHLAAKEEERQHRIATRSGTRHRP